MTFRTPAALLATAALALGATACGGDGAQSSGGGGGPKPVAKVENLTGVNTEVRLDKGFQDALKSLKVTPGPVGRAKVAADGVASFPITGGNVEYFTPGSVSPYVRGIINHDQSGLSLKAGGKTVELENFNIDPGRSILTGDVSLDGNEVAPQAPLFFLDGRTLKALQTTSDGNAVLEGTTLVLTKTAADLLNKTFGVDAFDNTIKIGVAKITIATK